jgi:spore germination cell wall hydrolase CwlJ-like protein
MKYSLKQRLLLAFGASCIILGLTLGEPKVTTQVASSGSISTINLKEKECLKSILWYESRSESELAIKAVATVVLNRLDHKLYPSTICGIKQQSYAFSYVKQLEASGTPLDAPTMHSNAADRAKYQLIEDIATQAVSGGFKKVLPENALHYAHYKVDNYWTRKKKVYARVDKHVFYLSDSGI